MTLFHAQLFVKYTFKVQSGCRFSLLNTSQGFWDAASGGNDLMSNGRRLHSNVFQTLFSMTVCAEYVGKPWSTSHCKVSRTAYSRYTCLCGTVLILSLNELIICLNGLFPGRQLLKTKTWDCDFIRVYTVSRLTAVISNRTVTQLLFPLRQRLKVGRNEFPAGS